MSLGHAIACASYMHRKDKDRGGKPYILHPLRIMMRLRTDDEELMSIAILHDVIEDHGKEFYSFEGENGEIAVTTVAQFVQRMFSDRVKRALEILTHDKSEPYEQYIDRICTNYDCIRIKMEDLRDNSDITRLKGIREKDVQRMVKYQHAYLKLAQARKKFEEELMKGVEHAAQ